MIKKTRIALVSDLHIGREAISSDLCPHPLEPSVEFALAKNFLEKFEKFVNSTEFMQNGPIDMLCITGDISDEADPAEFVHANWVIKKIAGALKVPQDKIFFVPGNHDVHWPVMKLVPTNFWDKYRYEPLLQKDLLFRSRIDAATMGSFDQNPHFVVWQSDGNLIVGINSAASDDPKPADGKHHGLIQEQTLSQLDTFLETLPEMTGELRLCLLHHHPINYSDFKTDYADFSAATNAENLFKLLSRHRFDLIFHGHKHVAHLTHSAHVSNGHPLTVLGAGSLSAQIASRWCGLAQNQFHVVEVEGRDERTFAAFGHVSTWNFLGEQWREGNSQLGLCAKEGFGTCSTPAELEIEIMKNAKIVLNDSGMVCRWSHLERLMPRIAYANTQAVFDALKNVAYKLELEFIGELLMKKQSWMLVKDQEDEK